MNMVILLLTAPHLLLDSLVCKVLWNWFLVPLGVPAVEWAHALGIGLLVLLVSPHPYRNPKATVKERLDKFIQVGFVKPLFLLGLGWIALSLMRP